MTRRSTFRGRSPVEWGVRAVLALGATWLGFDAITATLAYSIRGRDVERAYALAPGDGRIAALLSVKRIGEATDNSGRTKALQLAKAALRQDPTAVAAVTTLGIAAQAEDNATAARTFFTYSQWLSRRNLWTQLWAIEDAVARNDIPATLKSYDIALRTSRAASDLLFPVLGKAITEPEIRTNLVRTLVQKPVWAEGFVDAAPSIGSNAQATALFLRDLRRKGYPVSDVASTTMVKVLAERNFLNDAWTYYATVRPNVDRRRSRDPFFSADLAIPSPFDWIISDDAGISASMQRGEQGGLIDFTAPASVGGTVVRQVQMLPPGEYILTGHSTNIEQTGTSLPYWLLACENGRELGRVVVTSSQQARGRFMGQLRVSADCPVQSLSLVVRPSDSLGGVSGQIDLTELREAR